MKRGSNWLKARVVHALVTGLLIAGCSSSTDSSGGGGGGGPGPTLTDEQRFAALEAVSAKIDALTGADADSRRAELLAYLESREEFEASGTNTDGSLWARFTDGRLFLILANDDDLAGLPAAPLAGAVPASQSGPLAVRQPARLIRAPGPPAELPVSTQAHVLGGGEPTTSPFMVNFI